MKDSETTIDTVDLDRLLLYCGKSYNEIQENIYFSITKDNITDVVNNLYKQDYSNTDNKEYFKKVIRLLSLNAVGTAAFGTKGIEDRPGLGMLDYTRQMEFSEESPFYKKYAIKIYYGTTQYNSYKNKENIEKELQRILKNLELSEHPWLKHFCLEDNKISESKTPLVDEFIIVNGSMPRMFKYSSRRYFYYKVLSYKELGLSTVTINIKNSPRSFSSDNCDRHY